MRVLASFLLVLSFAFVALCWDPSFNYATVPTNDAFNAAGPFQVSNRRLRAGFYVQQATANRKLCASRSDNLWASQGYPAAACVDSDFKLQLKEFWVTVNFRCTSKTTNQQINVPWRANLFVANPDTDPVEIPIGTNLVLGPSNNVGSNWFTDENPKWEPIVGQCNANTIQFVDIAPHISFCSNDAGGQNPLLIYFHVGHTSGEYWLLDQPTGLTSSCYFQPTSPTKPVRNFCDTSAPQPPPVTKYLLYSSYDSYNEHPGFYPPGCTKYGASIITGRRWTVTRGGQNVAVQDPTTLRSWSNLRAGDVLTMTWTGLSDDRCDCVLISSSVKKTNVPTFDPNDNQALTDPWSYVIARKGQAGSISVTMPSRELACNYQVDVVVGPPLKVVGPQGAYYGSGTRVNNGKNPGPDMLIDANNGGDGTCARYFVPNKWWLVSEGAAAQLQPPATLPTGFTVTLTNAQDGTSAQCTYNNQNQLSCVYNNNGKGDGRTDGLFVNVGAGAEVVVTESAWTVNEQVSPRSGQRISAADEWVTCGANGYCAVNITNRLRSICEKGDSLTDQTCGCLGECFSVELTGRTDATGTSTYEWTSCNGDSPSPPCAVPISEFTICTDGGQQTVGNAYATSGTFSANGCDFTVTNLVAGTAGAPCTGYRFTPVGQCWAARKCVTFPVTIFSTSVVFPWKFYQRMGTDLQLRDVTVVPDGCCFITNTCAPPPPPPPPPTTTPVATTTLPGQTTPVPETTTPASTTPAPCPDTRFQPPDCTACVDLSSLNYTAWCVSDQNTPPAYTWLALPVNVAPPAGSVRPGTNDVEGFPLTCDCTVIRKKCPVDCASSANPDPTKCVCDEVTGTCVSKPECNVDQQCPDTCPVVNGLLCNGKGACNCDTCVCASVNGVQYTGAACDGFVQNPCYGYADCATCLADVTCNWCSAGGGKCQPSDTCANNEKFDTCVSTVVFKPVECPNNCSGAGECKTEKELNVTVCVCVKGAHGADCSKRGAKNAGAVAGAISGGVIAAIVIAGVIILVVISFGAKKGVDWAMFKEMNMAASAVNPEYKPASTESTSGLYAGGN